MCPFLSTTLCSIFVGRQINHLHTCVSTKGIRRLHEPAISTPREEIAKFGEGVWVRRAADTQEEGWRDRGCGGGKEQEGHHR